MPKQRNLRVSRTKKQPEIPINIDTIKGMITAETVDLRSKVMVLEYNAEVTNTILGDIEAAFSYFISIESEDSPQLKELVENTLLAMENTQQLSNLNSFPDIQINKRLNNKIEDVIAELEDDDDLYMYQGES